jgi:hypothetical protein
VKKNDGIELMVVCVAPQNLLRKYYTHNANDVQRFLPAKGLLEVCKMSIHEFLLANVFDDRDQHDWNVEKKSLETVRQQIQDMFPTKKEGEDYFLFEYNNMPYGIRGLAFALKNNVMTRVMKDMPFLQRTASITLTTNHSLESVRFEGKYGTKKNIMYKTHACTWRADNFDLHSVLEFHPIDGY